MVNQLRILLISSLVLTSCGSSDVTFSFTWRGSFSSTNQGCISISFSETTPIEPPETFSIESVPDIDQLIVGSDVTLYLSGELCPFSGTVQAGGKLIAEGEPACLSRDISRKFLVIENVFQSQTGAVFQIDATGTAGCYTQKVGVVAF